MCYYIYKEWGLIVNKSLKVRVQDILQSVALFAFCALLFRIEYEYIDGWTVGTTSTKRTIKYYMQLLC